MISLKSLPGFMLIVMALAVIPNHSAADRLYTWTDEKGVSHVTQHPPPASAKNKDVIDYSQRTHREKQAAAANRKKEQDLQPEADQVPSGQSGSVEQYRKEIRQDMQKKAAEGKQTCYLQAPSRRVYVRVFSTNSYSERDQEIWKGWIEPNQQALVISPTKTVLYNRRWEEKGPFSSDEQRPCSGGGVIQIPSS